MKSTDKTHTPIITDREHEEKEPIEIDKTLEIELGLITTPLDSPLHLANRILSAAYYLPCALSDDALKHRSVEIRNQYYWIKTNPCAATYQGFVDRGKGTSCKSIPDVWPDLIELWTEGTSCNKLPDYKILYWDG